MYFRGFTTTEVATYIAMIERITVARGVSQSGSVVVKKLQALNYQLNNCIKLGRVPKVSGFDAQVLVKSIGGYSLSVKAREVVDDAQTPNKFKYDCLIYCQKSVIMYLK